MKINLHRRHLRVPRRLITTRIPHTVVAEVLALAPPGFPLSRIVALIVEAAAHGGLKFTETLPHGNRVPTPQTANAPDSSRGAPAREP